MKKSANKIKILLILFVISSLGTMISLFGLYKLRSDYAETPSIQWSLSQQYTHLKNKTMDEFVQEFGEPSIYRKDGDYIALQYRREYCQISVYFEPARGSKFLSHYISFINRQTLQHQANCAEIFIEDSIGKEEIYG